MDFNFINRLSTLYGDSFYLLDTDELIYNFDRFLTAFRCRYQNTDIAYSYKTNYIPALCTLLHDLGGKAEIVSEMEYEMAIRNGVACSDIYYNGPYKKHDFLIKILDGGCNINLDNYQEFEFIKKTAAVSSNCFPIGLRCNYDIGNDRISRFGFDITDSAFTAMLQEIKTNNQLVLTGIHSHFPDRSLDSFSNRVSAVGCLLKKLDALEMLDDLKYVSFGGGFYSKPTERLSLLSGKNIPGFDKYADIICSLMNFCFKDKTEKPKLILEPGTAIVADVMYFIAKVIAIKNVRGKNFAIISGSIYNINPSVKGINRSITVLSERKKFSEIKNTYDIVGYTCIEDDVLYHNFVGELAVGDYIIFNNVGSYSVVFKPPFILPNVPILMKIDVDWKVIKRQETVDDVLCSYINYRCYK